MGDSYVSFVEKGVRRPVPRTYNQGCMLAYALDNLGERWTLLIVRDLLLGPLGFVDLQTSLGGIGGSILSKRLKDLEELRIVTTESPDGKRGLYRLTKLGEQLRPTIRTLMRWSVRFMKETADSETRVRIFEEVNKPDSVALGLEVFAEHHREPALSYVAQLIIDSRPYTAYYIKGDMILKRGGDTPAMARVETNAATVLAGLRRELTPREARASSTVEGDEGVLAHLFQCIGGKQEAEKAA